VFLVFAITTPPMIRAWRYKRSFDATLKRYLTEVRKEDYRAAYMQSGEEFRAATPYEGFVRIHQSLTSYNGRLTTTEQGQTVVEGRGDPTMWVGAARVNMPFERQQSLTASRRLLTPVMRTAASCRDRRTPGNRRSEAEKPVRIFQAPQITDTGRGERERSRHPNGSGPGSRRRADETPAGRCPGAS
jgi:hypothetical protein